MNANELNKLNVTSLKSIAREKGIKLRSNTQKQEIIAQSFDSGFVTNKVEDN